MSQLDDHLDWYEDRCRSWVAEGDPFPGVELLLERLDTAADDVRRQALVEGLKIEIEHRLLKNQGVNLGSIRNRFPDDSDVVSEAISDLLTILAQAGPSDRTDFIPSKRYEILWQIGDSRDEVYLAWDHELHRRVAVKRIKGNPTEVGRRIASLIKEARITASLDHPNITPVYGLWTDDEGRTYYAMRHIEGHTLKELIDSENCDRSANSDFVCNLVRHLHSAALAVDFAHKRNVLHRDLKPENIMIGTNCGVQVIDWGLAMKVGPWPEVPDGLENERFDAETAYEATADGTIKGTPTHMSPEQARGEISALTSRTDVYALGAILYTVLSGKPPVEGDSRVEILRRVRAGDLAKLRDVNSQADRALEAVCLKAMSLDPEGRYASAAEFAMELDKWLNDKPLNVYPGGPRTRARRWAKRNRAKSAMMAALGAVVLATATYELWIWNEIWRKGDWEFLQAKTLGAAARQSDSPKLFFEAISSAQRSAQLFEDSGILSRLLRPRAARARTLEKKLTADSGELESSLELTDQAKHMLRKTTGPHQAGNATALLQQAVKKWDRNAEAWLMLGEIQHQSGRFEVSETAFREAARLRPKDSIATLRVAHVLDHEKKYDEAESWLDTLVKGQPEWAEAHFALADVRYHKGDTAGALALLNRMVKSSGCHPQFIVRYAFLLLVEGRDSEARRWYLKAVDADPGDAYARYMLAMYLMEQGKIEDAHEAMRQAVEAGSASVASTLKPALKYLSEVKAIRSDIRARLSRGDTVEEVLKLAWPMKGQEQFLLGEMTYHQGDYRTSALLFEASLNGLFKPKLRPGDISPQSFFVAALAAIRASAMVDESHASEQNRWRKRALGWANDYVEALKVSPNPLMFEDSANLNRRRLLTHPAFEPVRGPALRNLPIDVQDEWITFWRSEIRSAINERRSSLDIQNQDKQQKTLLADPIESLIMKNLGEDMSVILQDITPTSKPINQRGSNDES